MSQINVNGPGDGGDRAAAAGINLLTVVIALVILAMLAWAVFAGPLSGVFFNRTTNININPPPGQSQPGNNNPNPQQPQPPQPQQPGGAGGGGTQPTTP